MDSRLASHRALLEMQGRLFVNCFAGVDDAKARERTGPRTNHMAFLGAHLAESRHYLAGLLGGGGEVPFGGRFADLRSIDEMTEPPPVEEILAAWRDVSAELERTLENAGPERLDAEPPFAVPLAEPTAFGTVSFLVHHEAYHLGQLALLRKHVGLPAMSYD